MLEKVIADLLFAYLNKDMNDPQRFEIEAIKAALPHVKGHIDERLYQRYIELLKKHT